MTSVFFMCDLFTHPVDYKLTNHEWVVDFWLDKKNYNVVKASDVITEKNDVWPYLAKEPYSNLEGSQITHISRYLKKTLGTYDVIIAFECKQQTRNIITDIHNTIIYAFFSPLRFTDRLSFTFTSNNINIQKKIEIAHSNASVYFHNQAAYIKNLMTNKYDPLNIPKESTLLIGQVEEDLAVWNNKEYLNLDSFEDTIVELCKNTTNLYKAHPFSKNNNKKIQSKENIKIIDDEIYRLLSSESITRVITVSSSVAKEAEFFGKKVIQFFSGYITDKAKSIPYTQDPIFWQFLLDKENITTPELKIDYIDIRPIRSTYWGYKNVWDIELSESQLLSKIRQHIDVLNQKTTQGSEQINTLNQQVDFLTQKFAHSNQYIDTLKQQINQSNQQIDTLAQETIENNQHINKLSKKLNMFKKRYFLIRKPRFLRKK